MKLRRTKGEGSARQPRLMEGQDDTSFRRSRTLQGSTSSKVKAVSGKRASLKSDRLKKQQLFRRQRSAVSGLLGLIIVICGLYYLISQYSGGIDQISFSPTTNTNPPTDTYKKVISEYLQAQPSERFRFALSNQNLTQFVASKLPEVKEVRGSGGQANKANFAIKLRQPIASWKSTNGQSFVDQDGNSFTRNYFATPSVVVADNSGANNTRQTGGVVVSERFLRFLGRIVTLLNTSGLGNVSEASLPRSTTREIDVKLSGRPYVIKTHIDRDPAGTVEDIKRVVGYLDQHKLTASYIDVRVIGRAFYQ